MILTQVSLSFLGLGLSPGDPARSIMAAKVGVLSFAHGGLFFLPGLVILAVVLAANSLGDGMKDIWAPKLRRV